MSLDIVELFMDVEENLGVKIPDVEMQAIDTIGSLVDVVYSRLKDGRDAACLTSHYFYRLRSELMREFRYLRHDVRPSLQITALIPKDQRRRLWRKLKDHGLTMPSLELSPLVYRLTAALVFGIALSIAIQSMALIPFILIIPLGLMAQFVTRPLRVHVPKDYDSVRRTVLYLSATHLHSNTGTFTRGEIAERVRLIVAENLGIPLDHVKEESVFADFGF